MDYQGFKRLKISRIKFRLPGRRNAQVAEAEAARDVADTEPVAVEAADVDTDATRGHVTATHIIV